MVNQFKSKYVACQYGVIPQFWELKKFGSYKSIVSKKESLERIDKELEPSAIGREEAFEIALNGGFLCDNGDILYAKLKA